MKAYQLKIAIKNSKPPIWRRCIIPAGITFSQLCVILNEVMGWSGYHLSEFEFYHLQLQLQEKDDFNDFMPIWDFDLLDSSKTYINEYMEQQKWFTYTYDFGDDWQHRVTIEKIIEDYPNNYPQVIRYKGDCPMEDCGGIEGYYECIDVIENFDHPESDERRRWAESQGYGNTYDMDEVNKDLQETCYVIFGKGDKRKKHDIYEDMLNNKFGLIASKTAKNLEKKIQSKSHKTDDLLQQIANRVSILAANKISQENPGGTDTVSLKEDISEDFIQAEAKKYIEEILSKNSKSRKLQLIELLNSYGKEDLKDLAFIHDLRNISSLKKAELANRLKDKMLLPETLRDTCVVLPEDEIRTFERIAECNIPYYIKKSEEDLLQKFIDQGYIGICMDDQVDIPEDVIQLYQQINTVQFQNLRKRISWLVACFNMATWFYGAVPADIMIKVFNQKKGLKTDRYQLLEDYEKIPWNRKNFVLINDLFVHRNLLENDNYIYLMRNQGDKKYYIPTEQEILDIKREYFLTKDSAVMNLIHYFVKRLDIPEDEATLVVRDIQYDINGGGSMHDIFDIVNDRGICFKEENDFKQIVPLINDLWNNTRMLLNRGFMPSELFQDERMKLRPFGPNHMPTIVAGSSEAAKLLMESKEHIEKLGFPIDFESNVKEISVYSMPSGVDGSIEMKTNKIYPNDPCPCGSGKKYKKCCGR